jgi:hypothetical protein
MSGNVTKGAVIRCGGSWYLATEDTAITGTASPYVQLTPNVDGSELNAAYVASLTGVSFNKIYNNWSDVQGRVYLFDEAYAYAWGQIPAMNTIEAWRPANTNLAKLLTAGIGKREMAKPRRDRIHIGVLRIGNTSRQGGNGSRGQTRTE